MIYKPSVVDSISRMGLRFALSGQDHFGTTEGGWTEMPSCPPHAPLVVSGSSSTPKCRQPIHSERCLSPQKPSPSSAPRYRDRVWMRYQQMAGIQDFFFKFSFSNEVGHRWCCSCLPKAWLERERRPVWAGKLNPIVYFWRAAETTARTSLAWTSPTHGSVPLPLLLTEWEVLFLLYWPHHTWCLLATSFQKFNKQLHRNSLPLTAICMVPPLKSSPYLSKNTTFVLFHRLMQDIGWALIRLPRFCDSHNHHPHQQLHNLQATVVVALGSPHAATQWGMGKDRKRSSFPQGLLIGGGARPPDCSSSRANLPKSYISKCYQPLTLEWGAVGKKNTWLLIERAPLIW